MSILKKELERIHSYVNENAEHIEKNLCVLHNKVYKPSDLGISSRTIGNWKDNGLLNGISSQKWHKFDFIDCIWLSIVKILREFNISLSIIKTLKEKLYESIGIPSEVELQDIVEGLNNVIEKEKASLSLKRITIDNVHEFFELERPKCLEIAVLEMIMSSCDYYLLVNKLGECALLKHPLNEILKNNKEYADFYKNPHISISLINVFFDLSNQLIREVDLMKLDILSSMELEILHVLRQNDIKKLEINFADNNEPSMLKITKNNKLDTAKRVKELFINKAYQDIKIITQNGKAVYYENTIKKKL